MTKTVIERTMKNKIILISLILSILVGLLIFEGISLVNASLNSSLPICDMDNDIDISDIPCMEVTPMILNYTQCNVTIININDSSINYTINMTPYIDGKYNFSFNVPYSNNSRTFYTLTLCDNSTTNITINYIETADEYWYIYLIFLISFLIILMIGESQNNYIFKYLAGCFLIVIGIYLFIYGIPGQALSWLDTGDSSSWVSYVAFVMILLGLVYNLRTVYENVWGGEEL